MTKILLQVLAWTVVSAVLILWPAGTLAYPGGWAFIALFGLGGVAMTVWLANYNPRLLRERMGSPVQRDQKPWDRVFLTLFMIVFVGWLAFMGWDAGRAGFAATPPWLQAIGAAGVLLYMGGCWWTFRENTFAAPVVKIQADQRVIDTGPYAFARHPMYASAMLLFIGAPLLLGSLRGLIVSAVLILAIAWRSLREEDVLRAELPGYADYAARVRYRFIPFVW